jgi:hypothetical protein
MLDKSLQSDLALSEVADDEHVFRWNSVVRHLSDAAGGNSERLREGFVTADACFKPLFEVHGDSLEQPKRFGQGISKPLKFSVVSTMDDLTQHRKKRLEQLIAAAPYNGDRALFLKKVQLTKGRLSQILDSKEVFGELSAMRMAQKLGLDARYFESGAPGKPIAWPFTLVTPSQIQQLRPKHLQMVQKFTLDLLESQDLAVVPDGAQANTSGKRSTEAGIIQLKTTRKKIAKRVPNDGEKKRNL